MIREVTDTLACFRLTKLAIDDEITKPWRDRILERHPPADTKLGYWLTCPWCFSATAGAFIVLARRLAPRAWQPLAQVLAMSAMTGLLDQLGD